MHRFMSTSRFMIIDIILLIIIVFMLMYYVFTLHPSSGHHVDKISAGIRFNLRNVKNRKGEDL
jgi:hypothetical protein